MVQTLSERKHRHLLDLRHSLTKALGHPESHTPLDTSLRLFAFPVPPIMCLGAGCGLLEGMPGSLLARYDPRELAGALCLGRPGFGGGLDGCRPIAGRSVTGWH